MTACPRDLLKLIFSEIEFGKDMINFSELSHRCNQIFHQNIKIRRQNQSASTYRKMSMFENPHTYVQHGLYRMWHPNGKLWHSINRFRGRLHGVCTEYAKSGSILVQKYYCHGTEI